MVSMTESSTASTTKPRLARRRARLTTLATPNAQRRAPPALRERTPGATLRNQPGADVKLAADNLFPLAIKLAAPSLHQPHTKRQGLTRIGYSRLLALGSARDVNQKPPEPFGVPSPVGPS